MSEGIFIRKFVRPLIDLLRQGVTPEKLALSVALGAALGIFPVMGTTTALCAIAALVLRLNLPAIQIANYAMYPLQLLLILPFCRFGETLFRADHQPLSKAQLVSAFHAGVLHAIETLWRVIFRAAVAWLLVAPVVACTAYVVLLPLFRRIGRRIGPESRD